MLKKTGSFAQYILLLRFGVHFFRKYLFPVNGNHYRGNSDEGRITGIANVILFFRYIYAIMRKSKLYYSVTPMN